MKVLLISAAVLLAIVLLGLLLVLFLGPAIQRAIFYPQPPALPAVVENSTPELLAELQKVLDAQAPAVAQALQPGLSDEQITALEKEGQIHLSEDLRALYRWHNGMAPGSTARLLPGQRFVPLEAAVQQRAGLSAQLPAANMAQRAAFSAFAGHRRGWLQVLDDGAGDGYFYDPQRGDEPAAGAFFYYMAEAHHYQWFPSLRNFLSGVIECYRSGAVDTQPTTASFQKMQEIWDQVGASN